MLAEWILLFVVGAASTGLLWLFFGKAIMKRLPVCRYKLELAALLGFALIGLFPPWVCRYERERRAKSEGWRFLFAGNEAICQEAREVYDDGWPIRRHSEMVSIHTPVRIDVSKLSVEWVLWAGLCGGAIWIRRRQALDKQQEKAMI